MDFLARQLPFLYLVPPAVAFLAPSRSRARFTALAFGGLIAVGVLAVTAGNAGSGGVALRIVLSGGLTLFALWMRGKQDEGASEARNEALLRGLRIEEVEREMPHFEHRSTRFTLRPGKCVKYAIPRSGSGGPASWSFLMRNGEHGAQFPNGWLFVGPGGPLPDGMKTVLDEIASEVDDEYLELEGSPTEVMAFWEAWGGAEQTRRLHGWMERLARC